MERKCPSCGGKMKKIGDGGELPSVPFIKIPEWVKELSIYECTECGYIGIWHD